MPVEIWVAIIGFCATVTAALIGYWGFSREKKRRAVAELEMNIQADGMGFAEFIDEWQAVHQSILDVIKNTNIDRVLILKAWNGHMEPKWATAVLQVRESGQEPISYQHYELDDDYINRLRSIANGSTLKFKTAEIPPCGIKEIYELEGVTESLWSHIGSRSVANSDSRVITYASVSTHHPDGITDAEATRCKLLLDRMRAAYNVFTLNNSAQMPVTN